MSITLGVHTALTTCSAAFRRIAANTVVNKPDNRKTIKTFNTLFFGTSTIATAARVVSAFNLAFAVISPTTRAANVAFSAVKWTITVIWTAGSILGLSAISQKNNSTSQFVVKHAETFGQATAVAITVGLAIAHVIGPLGIIVGLVGPALYFASVFIPHLKRPPAEEGQADQAYDDFDEEGAQVDEPRSHQNHSAANNSNHVNNIAESDLKIRAERSDQIDNTHNKNGKTSKLLDGAKELARISKKLKRKMKRADEAANKQNGALLMLSSSSISSDRILLNNDDHQSAFRTHQDNDLEAVSLLPSKKNKDEDDSIAII